MKTFFRKSLSCAVLLGSVLLPATSQASIIFNYGMCNPSEGCTQSVNFAPANSGTTVVGDTNPPAPLYNVYIDSLQGLTLHGSGSTVDTVSGSGFDSILIRPESGYAWGAVEFQLDSLVKTQPQGTSGLTFTAYDASNTAFIFPANFPWEGNRGENQHYQFQATNGEVISRLEISYVDPLCVTGTVCNTIQDIHNIDVNTIPVPAAVYLFLSGLLGLVGIARRKV